MAFWDHPLIKNIGPDQIKSLYANTPITASGRYINTLIIAYCLWGIATTNEIIAWIGINFIGATYALYRWYLGRKRTYKVVTKKAIRHVIFLAVYFTIPWATMILMYLGDLSTTKDGVILFCTAGMAAAGSIQLSRVFPAAVAYLTIIGSAIIAKSLYIGTEASYLVVLTAFVYGIFLYIVTRQICILSIRHSKTIKAHKIKIRELAATKKKLLQLAMEDPLTGLPNRREFQLRLDAAVSEAQRQGTSVSLLICDLDHFKNINDISGHAAGDAVLTQVAERLQGIVREYDIVARIGGDEFAIIAKHHKSPKEAADFANRILHAVNVPINSDGSTINPGISIGISMQPFDAQDSAALMAHADLALQRGKAICRGQFNFFDQQMKTQLSTDEAMETDLRLALVEEEFELLYQPKVSIATGKLEGFEALIRWNHSSGKVISPLDFFSVAEVRGLIPFITDFVINQAFKDMLSWKSQGLEPGRIAINIHPTQIKDEHRMKRIARDVERMGLDPSDIYLEITEDCIIGRGTEEIPQLLNYLRSKGLRISLDDFGTGFASLSHLKNLPVDELKIDRTFINDLLEDATNRAIVHAMIKLASSLGISTVAEGIETQEQHTVLLAMGCATGQGYLYNRPLSKAKATELIISTQSQKSQNQVCVNKITSSKILLDERNSKESA